MPQWQITVNIDDRVAITIGRTVAPHGDAASDDECRMAFAAALPQFMSRAMSARFAQALADRAAVRANDLASAVVTVYPEGYEPQVAPVSLREPVGPHPDLITGPQTDPVYSRFSVAAGFAGAGDIEGGIVTSDATG